MVYQVCPSDLPANAPEPPWQAAVDLPDVLKGPIVTARLEDAFQPSSYDDEVEEAHLSDEDWMRYSFSDPEEDEERQRAHEHWGTW